ncbi:MAG: TetR/AcrR family transcriptional regulator, partial [Chloroflexota bacterium]
LPAPEERCEKKEKLDPRIVRTRRDLVESMRTLLSEKSFTRISVQEITERALINRATFYAHFEDKFHLLQYMLRESFEEKVLPRVHFCDGISKGNLHTLTVATCEFLAEFNDLYAPKHSNDHPPIERLIQPLILQILMVWFEISDGETAVKQPAEKKAITLSWAIFGSALQWSRSGRTETAEKQSELIVDLLLSGVNVNGKREIASSEQ